ncbi:MAG: type VI secretion system baseplate subunit TssG [Akkermansia sp.]
MDTQRAPTSRLEFEHELSTKTGDFSFFATVRRLNQINQAQGKTPSEGESVVFSQIPHLCFPPSELSSYKPGAPAQLQIYFFGLLGPNGPMPLSFTEYVHSRSRNYLDQSMQRFLDIFHDRLISLFYKAGTRHEQAISYDSIEDPLSRYLDGISGIPLADGHSCLPHHAQIRFTNLLAEARSASNLTTLLEEFFKIPVRISQWEPTFLQLDSSCLCYLGKHINSATLGINSILGEKQMTLTEDIAVHLGPLSYNDFLRFLPGTPSYKRLNTWIRLFADHPIHWFLHLSLKSDSVPFCMLDGYNRLGYDTWLLDKNDLSIGNKTVVLEGPLCC